MKELRNKLNKRRRKRFRTHQVTEVFKCFCKREYLSYPALYLHVKLKHQHRITAKDQVTKLNLVNEEKHDFKKVTRLYQLQWLQGKRSRKKLRTKHRSKTDVIPQRRSTRDLLRQESKSQTISEIIQEYCAQLQSQRMDEQFDDISLVLYLVKAYINQNYSSFDHRQPPENQNYCQTFDAKSLPFSFNFLVSRYIPQFCCMNAAKLQKHCILFDLVRLKSELKAFNEWLCTKGYSSFNRFLQ